MKQKEIIQNITTTVCIGILMIFCLSILARSIARQVLFEKLHLSNIFVQWIFWDNEDMAKIPYESVEGVEPDEKNGVSDIAKPLWRDLYPFRDTDRYNEAIKASDTDQNYNLHGITMIRPLQCFDEYKSKIARVETKIEQYTTELLMGYEYFRTGLTKYEKLLLWNVSKYSAENDVVELADGHLTTFNANTDVTASILSFKAFSEFCEEQGTDLVYIQSPYKISKYTDINISGVMDFSNQNADRFMEGIRDCNVEILDLRDCIYEQGLNHHDLFYITDHHWKGEAGLWAAREVVKFLSGKYDIAMDDSLLSPEKFTYVVYEKIHMGSCGRALLADNIEADDLALAYPCYDTSFTYEIPSVELYKQGDFSIMYDMSKVENRNWHANAAYSVYNWADNAITKIHNNYNSNGYKLLIIKDSFVNCVAPFVAVATEDVEILDLRGFSGSVETYVEKSKPDCVIVMYNPGAVAGVNWNHQSLFDFR